MLMVFNGYTTHTNGALGDGLLLLFHVFFPTLPHLSTMWGVNIYLPK